LRFQLRGQRGELLERLDEGPTSVIWEPMCDWIPLIAMFGYLEAAS
jgi:hypothetical protein